MASSGTFAFNPENADLLLEAFDRIGKRSNQIDAAMLQSAVSSSNLALAAWSNKGVNLWAVDLQTVALVVSVDTIALPTDTVQVLSAYIRTGTPPTDRPLSPIGRDDYAMVPDKTITGLPVQYWFQRLAAPLLTFYMVPDANGPYELNYYRMRRLQDMGMTMGETSDIVYRFLDAFCADLAVRLSVKYAVDRYNLLKTEAKEAWDAATAEDREKAPIQLSPDLSSYYG